MKKHTCVLLGVCQKKTFASNRKSKKTLNCANNNQKRTYLGMERFKILKNQTKLKIIALGGLNQNNIKKLKLLNVFGFAAISFFKEVKKNGPYTNKGRLNFLV